MVDQIGKFSSELLTESILLALVTKYHRVLSSSSHLLRASWLRVMESFKQPEVGVPLDFHSSICWILPPTTCPHISASQTR